MIALPPVSTSHPLLKVWTIAMPSTVPEIASGSTTT